ncbi:MAG TPA: methionine--tRNA ligase [Terriglobales bacterium]|nr:methionine--tRNA ligase [Terriglobales bacterium]
MVKDDANAKAGTDSKPGKFYITTPIYYVNGRPHLGHAYTTIAADAITRWQRMHGVETLLLTGTDEHGQKMERSAALASMSPGDLADQNSAAFRALWDRMGIRYDEFVRTTEERHTRAVLELFERMKKAGYIYKGSYTGQYCVFDELYVDAAGPGAPCPECGRPTETISEHNFFFKLSAFEEKLLQFYDEHPGFIRPEARRNEALAFVRGGLRDLSISRATIKWGIPLPDDPNEVIYVWLDALTTYISGLGFGSPGANNFHRYWPADVHLIGKEIVRFHCVYWPAFLMAAGLEPPRSVVAHGWLLFEENKMSKSRGNIVRPDGILDTLGADALRYFLLREVVFGQDGSFSFDALVGRYNSDLANDLGNLASRTLTMIGKYFRAEIPYPSVQERRNAADNAIAELATQTIAGYADHFREYEFSRALESAWGLVGAVNKYIVEHEPWALAEKPGNENRSRLADVLFTSAEALRIVTALVHPVIPEATARIWSQLGLGNIEQVRLDQLKWGDLPVAAKLGKVEPVFPRAEKSVIERLHKLEDQTLAGPATAVAADAGKAKPVAASKPAEQPRAKAAGDGDAGRATQAVPASSAPRAAWPAPSSEPAGANAAAGQPAAQSAAPPPAGEKISIDDFAKVELRVGQVKVAEKVKGADKLLRLEVDIGTEVRQVVAGIAEAYDPATLVGRKVVIVANLAPRKLRGLESNGMIVAASVGEKGTPVLAGFLEDVPVGARLK